MSMSKTKLVAVAASLAAYYYVSCDDDEVGKARRKRRWWVKPYLLRRDGLQTTAVLITDLLAGDPMDLRNYLRLTHEQFLEIHAKISDRISKQNTVMRPAIASEVRLAICLRFLTTGDSYKSINFASRISDKTISTFIPTVLQAIYESLQNTYMKFPNTTEEWLEISAEFEKTWQFPHVLGALDGKHIGIKRPKHGGSMYHNYKGFHSIVLLALVDARYRFVYIDVGCNGRISDGGIYKKSNLYSAINGVRPVVPPAPLQGENQTNVNVPYYIVADQAFQLSNTLMKPFPMKGVLPINERVFNYRLSRARRVVENAFAHISNKFNILYRTISTNLETIDLIVLCICVLHNYLICKNIYQVRDEGPECNLLPMQVSTSNRSCNSAQDLRTYLSNYFVGNGNWNPQWNAVETRF